MAPWLLLGLEPSNLVSSSTNFLGSREDLQQRFSVLFSQGHVERFSTAYVATAIIKKLVLNPGPRFSPADTDVFSCVSRLEWSMLSSKQMVYTYLTHTHHSGHCQLHIFGFFIQQIASPFTALPEVSQIILHDGTGAQPACFLVSTDSNTHQ